LKRSEEEEVSLMGGGNANAPQAEPDEDNMEQVDAATMKAREWDEFGRGKIQRVLVILESRVIAMFLTPPFCPALVLFLSDRNLLLISTRLWPDHLDEMKLSFNRYFHFSSRSAAVVGFFRLDLRQNFVSASAK